MEEENNEKNNENKNENENEDENENVNENQNHSDHELNQNENNETQNDETKNNQNETNEEKHKRNENDKNIEIMKETKMNETQINEPKSEKMEENIKERKELNFSDDISSKSPPTVSISSPSSGDFALPATSPTKPTEPTTENPPLSNAGKSSSTLLRELVSDNSEQISYFLSRTQSSQGSFSSFSSWDSLSPPSSPLQGKADRPIDNEGIRNALLKYVMSHPNPFLIFQSLSSNAICKSNDQLPPLAFFSLLLLPFHLSFLIQTSQF